MPSNRNSKIDNPTPQELLRRATGMIPMLKSRAADTEELRRISDETVRDFQSVGLHRVGVPRRFGGLDVPDDLVF